MKNNDIMQLNPKDDPDDYEEKVPNSVVMPFTAMWDKKLTNNDKIVFAIIAGSYLIDPIAIRPEQMGNALGLSTDEVRTAIDNLVSQQYLSAQVYGEYEIINNVNNKKLNRQQDYVTDKMVNYDGIIRDSSEKMLFDKKHDISKTKLDINFGQDILDFDYGFPIPILWNVRLTVSERLIFAIVNSGYNQNSGVIVCPEELGNILHLSKINVVRDLVDLDKRAFLNFKVINPNFLKVYYIDYALFNHWQDKITTKFMNFDGVIRDKHQPTLLFHNKKDRANPYLISERKDLTRNQKKMISVLKRLFGKLFTSPKYRNRIRLAKTMKRYLCEDSNLILLLHATVLADLKQICRDENRAGFFNDCMISLFRIFGYVPSVRYLKTMIEWTIRDNLNLNIIKLCKNIQYRHTHKGQTGKDKHVNSPIGYLKTIIKQKSKENTESKK